MKLWPILIFVISFGTTYGQFAPPQIIPPLMWDLQFHDINSDGHPDMIGIPYGFHTYIKKDWHGLLMKMEKVIFKIKK